MLFFAVLATIASVAAATALPVHDITPQDSILNVRQSAKLPGTFKWTSSSPLIGPKNDGRDIKALKDPSIIEINGTHHVFASTAVSSGYNMVYLSFTDFAKANDATFYYLDQTPIGKGYRAAPQVFWFEPQKLWYLVYQNGNAAYSTNKDINDPAGWTAGKNFYSSQPSIIQQHISGGYWVDMWTICDSTHCHLFSSDDNGELYRSQTTIDKFPNGMGDTVIALSDTNKNNLFEASCVYKISDNSYLLIVEAIGSGANRYFRSWTSDSPSGKWTPLAATEANPFAGASNVVFNGTTWSKSISHGEMIRTQTDQTMTIDPCNMRFLYQGIASTSGTSYNSLPWKLGLITLTNPAC